MGRLDAPVQRRTYNDAFKSSVAALRDSGIPFACMGSLALWALGGPEPNLQQDLDFAICEEDADTVRAALAHAGFAIQQPPEDWLFKAWSGEPDGRDSALVDIIYRPAGLTVTPQLLDTCEVRSVLALEVRVLAPTDLLVTKLHSITEQNADYGSALQFARSLRERVDWPDLVERTASSPFGISFVALTELLGIAPEGTLVERLQLGRPLRDSLGVPAGSRGERAQELPRPNELEHIVQAIAEHDRGSMLDVRLGFARGQLTVCGDAASERHREEIETVVREAAPGLPIDNRIRVRHYAPADEPAERIS